MAGSAIASSALSYDRILGANKQIALGHIGVGNRGSEPALDDLAPERQVQGRDRSLSATSGRVNRERAVANSERYYGRAPRAFQYLEDLLAFKDVDAVLIATPEHSSTRRC